MGRTSSKIGGGNGGLPPAGITYNDFLKLSEDQRFDIISDIINNPNIKTPDYLDNSITTKVIYALGMDGKPTVVDDAVLDTMPGRDIFRTVYEQNFMPPPSTDAIIDQIRNGDYTHMSGAGGSFHSRAIYFATDFQDSALYGSGEQNPMVLRAKINPSAKIVSETNLTNQMMNKASNPKLNNVLNHGRVGNEDQLSLYAISQGVDGWYSGTYTMMVNRGNLTASKTNKRISGPGGSIASSWRAASDIDAPLF